MAAGGNFTALDRIVDGTAVFAKMGATGVAAVPNLINELAEV